MDFGGAMELLGGIPFPHSFDTYIQLLEEQQQQFKQNGRDRSKIVLGAFIQEQLQEQTKELKQELEEIENCHASRDRNGNGLAYQDNGGGQPSKDGDGQVCGVVSQ